MDLAITGLTSADLKAAARRTIHQQLVESGGQQPFTPEVVVDFMELMGRGVARFSQTNAEAIVSGYLMNVAVGAAATEYERGRRAAAETLFRRMTGEFQIPGEPNMPRHAKTTWDVDAVRALTIMLDWMHAWLEDKDPAMTPKGLEELNFVRETLRRGVAP